MLTENIMHDCVVKLLKSNDEEAFECLCKLLVTIGKDLDHARAKVCTVLISCCILPGMSGVSRYPKPFRHFFSKFVFMTPKGDCIVDLSLKTWYHWRATVSSAAWSFLCQCCYTAPQDRLRVTYVWKGGTGNRKSKSTSIWLILNS